MDKSRPSGLRASELGHTEGVVAVRTCHRIAAIGAGERNVVITHSRGFRLLLGFGSTALRLPAVPGGAGGVAVAPACCPRNRPAVLVDRASPRQSLRHFGKWVRTRLERALREVHLPVAGR